MWGPHLPGAPIPEDPTLFWPPWATGTHVVPRHTHRQNTQMHKIKGKPTVCSLDPSSLKQCPWIGYAAAASVRMQTHLSLLLICSPTTPPGALGPSCLVMWLVTCSIALAKWIHYSIFQAAVLGKLIPGGLFPSLGNVKYCNRLSFKAVWGLFHQLAIWKF